MWNRIKRWWQAEGALVGLQGISDRMLDDMGLERETLRARVLASKPDGLPDDRAQKVHMARHCTSA